MTLSFYRIALGALADIATMTPAELADGVAQRKALRIYHELLGAMADGSRGPAPRCATCVHFLPAPEPLRTGCRGVCRSPTSECRSDRTGLTWSAEHGCPHYTHDTGKADRLSWADDIEDLRRANGRR